jgi:hypothetical protein
MTAFPSLVCLERYGNVHQFDPTTVATIVDRLVNRISIGILLLVLDCLSREDSGEPLLLLERGRPRHVTRRSDRPGHHLAGVTPPALPDREILPVQLPALPVCSSGRRVGSPARAGAGN